jgi:hypothetical protein
MTNPTEAERKNLLSYDLFHHPEGMPEPHAPGSYTAIPAGFAMLVLSLRVSEVANVIPSLAGPIAMPTLNVKVDGFDGRHTLGANHIAPLGVDETMHALVGAIHVLARSLPKTDPRQKWCSDVVAMFQLFQGGGRAVATPMKPGVA